MPTIEISKKDLESLCGKKFAEKEEIATALEFAKTELDGLEGDKIIAAVADTNRPDLLSAEGIARELRSHYTKDKGIPKYEVKKSNIEVIVDKSVSAIRPCIAAAVIKKMNVSDEFLRQMIQLQEKVCLTFGRKRKEAAIGIYDWQKLKAPMHYRAYKPREKKFVPLEYKTEMDLEEILTEHPTGKEYSQLLKGFDKYPILEDNNNIVASMPPIINSHTTGKVTEQTKEVLIEVTGYKQETVNTALNIMVSALAERGFEVFSVKIKYPNGKSIVTPDFSPKKIVVNADSVKKITGINLNAKQAIALLRDARYEAKANGKKITAFYPAYRQDILHEVDAIEDILLSIGYNNIKPEFIELPCIGAESRQSRLIDIARDVCVGLQLQEVLTFTLTSREKQEKQICLQKEEFVEIANPVSANWSVFRKQIFPELLEFFGKNKNVQYPQKVFEIGKCLELNADSETGVNEPIKLCVAIAGKACDFTAIKSALEVVCKNLGTPYELSESSNPAFEKGKQGEIKICNKRGIVGEINSKTLHNFGIEMPTALFEIEI